MTDRMRISRKIEELTELQREGADLDEKTQKLLEIK